MAGAKKVALVTGAAGFIASHITRGLVNKGYHVRAFDDLSCALWQMQQHPIRRWFDPIVLATLLAVVPPFIPGMVVMLSDQRQAIVSKVHEDAPCYPEVQVLTGLSLMSESNLAEQREVIDLATTPDLHIRGVDGFQVADFLYGPRHIPTPRKYQRPETVTALG